MAEELSPEERIAIALELLDDAWNPDAETMLYDAQGVNQAHRVLAGGFAPRSTKCEGGI